MDVSALAERLHLPFPCLFVLVEPSADWMAVPPDIGEESDVLSLPIQILLPGHPLGQSSWHIKLTIITLCVGYLISHTNSIIPILQMKKLRSRKFT